MNANAATLRLNPDDLKKMIREVADFPKPGINFYDITTLLKDRDGLRGVVDALSEHYESADVDIVLGIEARGFIFAPVLAYALNAGFVPVRKPKKLPAPCERVEYALEYGTDILEIHKRHGGCCNAACGETAGDHRGAGFRAGTWFSQGA
jgi:adenine phosphoribosyltransferase